MIIKKSIFILSVVALLTACGGRESDSLSSETRLLSDLSIVTSSIAFSGPRQNYAITQIGTSYSIKDNVGSDGIKTALSTQRLVFTDASVNLSIIDLSVQIPLSSLTTLIELYVAFFNRVPDADGLAYWINQVKSGQTIESITESFYSAGIQYSVLTGYSASMSNSDFVNLVYKNVLGRKDGADIGGLTYWSNELKNGNSTRGLLVNTIIKSAHTYKGDPTYGWVADLLDNKAYVAKSFSIDRGLSYNSPNDSIVKGMAIAAAVTSNNITDATLLIQQTSQSCLILSSNFGCSSNSGTATTVFTLAGSGGPGWEDGPSARASFQYPSGVAVDSAGNIYVADTWNSQVRKIATSGVVSTFAAAGCHYRGSCPTFIADFQQPNGVAVDKNDNVYIVEAEKNRIQKITARGIVSTFAGSGMRGSTDGPGDSASFNYPTGVAIDTNGNLYIADFFNNKIRKITPAGVVSTMAGSKDNLPGYADGSTVNATFYHPGGVAVDASGNVYVADTANNQIRKITAAGIVSTVAGSGKSGRSDGLGANASFNNPQGVAVDANGNLYIADTDNNEIRKITGKGIVSTFSSGDFYVPRGIAVDVSGAVYVANSLNHKITKITQN